MGKQEMLKCILTGALQAAAATITAFYVKKALVKLDKAMEEDKVVVENVKETIAMLNTAEE